MYAGTMMKMLPLYGFKRRTDLTKEDLKKHDIPIGMFVELDLKYSARLHDDHNDFPVAVEKVSVP